jgi:nucleoside-diphosphate-sugar epimerase
MVERMEGIKAPMKKALVLGAGGFIGNHMVKRLKSEGFWVRGIDLKHPDFSESTADEFIERDLSVYDNVEKVIQFKGYQGNFYNEIPYKLITGFDEIYQFAADMGGAGYIFTGENDSQIMENSALINLNLLRAQSRLNVKYNINKTKIFYSSSACMYPDYKQLDVNNPGLKESDAYPADPDSEYGWEKLFSERMFLAFNRNNKIPVAIARYHNIYGPEGTWDGGKEKSPAAICRKVIQAEGFIEIWGDGEQTRSFLYIDECIEATRKLMQSNFTGPVNIGSEERVTINQLVDIACSIEGKVLKKNHIFGPLGVRGRNSNNDLVREKLNWDYSMTLKEGIEKTYSWILQEIKKNPS